MMGNLENEEARVFASNILTEPIAEGSKSSKTLLLKRKVDSGEGPKRKPKKSKIPQVTAKIEGVEGASVNDPGVKDSETLKGFRTRTTKSVVAEVHLRYLRDPYFMHQKVSHQTQSEEYPGKAEFQMLVDGFPKSLPLKTFCDPNVALKRVTESAYAMSLQWAESARINEEFEQEKSSKGESIRRIREERDSALAKKEKAMLKCDDLLRRHEKLVSDHAISEGKIKFEMGSPRF
ncbi:hypothetical protein LIER_15569 [Lithospermum erythrorhizon]|uniref:Uncharacterized protein n=1 Tax=Lithospermum erythrorhizon TaxID=34254 RepID=A0AAV3Q5D1_LITER